METIRRRFSIRLFDKEPESVREARSIDDDNNGTISKPELRAYIQKNAKLWAMLCVNLNMSESNCQRCATSVAYQLGKSLKAKTPVEELPKADRRREPTVEEVAMFLDFVKTPKGEQEFFHRTVFRAFDADSNGYLDNDELEKFLDVFYRADSIFAGDRRLPSKFMLKLKVLMDLDDGDGKLTFEEIRSLISGGAQTLTN